MGPHSLAKTRPPASRSRTTRWVGAASSGARFLHPAPLATMEAFYPNCTLPPEGTGYVASPNIRNTLDILWSSATIVACTYSVLHLNVPEQRRGRDPGWKGDLKWTFRRLRKKMKWCLVTVFLPEYIFSRAIADWLVARRQLRRLHRECPRTIDNVSLTHMLCANMGGFALSYISEGNSDDLPETGVSEQDSTVDLDGPMLTGSPFSSRHRKDSRSLDAHRLGDYSEVEMSRLCSMDLHARNDYGPSEVGSDVPDSDDKLKSANLEPGVRMPADHVAMPQLNDEACVTSRVLRSEHRAPDLFHLNAHTLLELIEDGQLPATLPPAEEITDRSKSDVLTKTILLLQISYYVVAVLERAATGLSISELELGTVAFVACSALTYLPSIQKPKDVETVIILQSLASPDLMSRVRKHAADSTAGSWFSDETSNGEAPRNDSAPRIGGYWVWDSWGTLLAAAIFSSIHVAGWNLDFASTAAMWIWRACAIATASLLGLVSVCGFLFTLTDSVGTLDTVVLMVLIVSAFLYGLARLALIVEMFRGLSYLPPQAFVATWTANVPHIG